MILAITGGTGFVGSHLLRAAVAAGHAVRALTRQPRAALAGVAWIAGDLAAPGDLCVGADAVIHLAGTINARDRAGFEAGNVAGTQRIIAAAQAAGSKRFIHVSSLAAREPGLSSYGATKAAAETLVRASGLDWAIVRPPGVYGPGDRETLPLFQMVARGIAVIPGPGRFSLIEVSDLVDALLALATGDFNGITEVDDGSVGYSHAELALAIGRALGRRPRMVRLPTAALRAGAVIDTVLAGRHRLPRLSFDRARYLAHPDWVADPARALPAAIWRPAVAADAGLARTIAWARQHRLLR